MDVGTFTGSGTLEANGGTGADYSIYDGGGGGGGYVTVTNSTNTFVGTNSANGGTSGDGTNGANGTLTIDP